MSVIDTCHIIHFTEMRWDVRLSIGQPGHMPALRYLEDGKDTNTTKTSGGTQKGGIRSMYCRGVRARARF